MDTEALPDHLLKPWQGPAFARESCCNSSGQNNPDDRCPLLCAEQRIGTTCCCCVERGEITVGGIELLLPLGDGDLADAEVSSDLGLRHGSFEQEASTFESPCFSLLLGQVRWLPAHGPKLTNWIKSQ